MSILTRRRIQLLREIDRKRAEISRAFKEEINYMTIKIYFGQLDKLYGQLKKYIKNSWGDWR